MELLDVSIQNGYGQEDGKEGLLQNGTCSSITWFKECLLYQIPGSLKTHLSL